MDLLLLDRNIGCLNGSTTAEWIVDRVFECVLVHNEMEFLERMRGEEDEGNR